QLCSAPHAGLPDLVQPFLPITRSIDLRTRAGNAPASIERLEPIHLMRDINPHLAFSVSFLTSLKKHLLYARSWKQWRLARGRKKLMVSRNKCTYVNQCVHYRSQES